MLYKIDKNPDWNVFLNMTQEANLTDESGGQQKVIIHKNPFPALHQCEVREFLYGITPRSLLQPPPLLRGDPLMLEGDGGGGGRQLLMVQR
jgi:hypothetical protein